MTRKWARCETRSRFPSTRSITTRHTCPPYNISRDQISATFKMKAPITSYGWQAHPPARSSRSFRASDLSALPLAFSASKSSCTRAHARARARRSLSSRRRSRLAAPNVLAPALPPAHSRIARVDVAIRVDRKQREVARGVEAVADEEGQVNETPSAATDQTQPNPAKPSQTQCAKRPGIGAGTSDQK